jgi:steroid delta-isomerase-like uncharacterized protein
MVFRGFKIICVLTLVAFSSCTPAAKNENKGKADAITEERRAYEELLAVWSGDDLAKLDKILVEEFIFEEPKGTEPAEDNSMRGRDRFKELVIEERVAFPDLKFQLRKFIQADNWAAAEWLMTGTHMGGYTDLPATNRSISLAGVSIIQFKSGKIIHERFYLDLWDFREQLGLISQ